jgi:hypothetical protein
MRTWSARRWWAAVVAAALTVLVVGIPTVLIPNPLFGREIPPTWWAWPALLVTAVLSGLVLATYVRSGAVAPADETASGSRAGAVGGFLAYLAVGCPVCNKLALIALGYTGALQWFAPVQPVLAVGGIALLAYALRRRLAGELACPVPAATSRVDA